MGGVKKGNNSRLLYYEKDRENRCLALENREYKIALSNHLSNIMFVSFKSFQVFKIAITRSLQPIFEAIIKCKLVCHVAFCESLYDWPQSDMGHSHLWVEAASLIKISVALCHSRSAVVFIGVRRLCLTAGCVCACVSFAEGRAPVLLSR